jgi:hypothetical protein
MLGLFKNEGFSSTFKQQHLPYHWGKAGPELNRSPQRHTRRLWIVQTFKVKLS